MGALEHRPDRADYTERDGTVIPHQAHVHLFIDRGSGQIIGWEIGSSFPQAQVFDGTHTAQACYLTTEARSFERALWEAEQELEQSWHRWVLRLPRRWATQAPGVTR